MTLFLDPRFLLELAMLSALLGVGTYVSWTDVKEHRVPNALSLGLLVVGVLGQLGMIALGVVEVRAVVGVVATGLILGLGLSVIGAWGPGDGKLFWATVTALPPTLYAGREWLSLESVWAAVLLNSLLCYLAVLLLIPFWRGETGRAAETQGRRIGEHAKTLLVCAGLFGLGLAFAVLAVQKPLTWTQALAVIVVGYRLVEWGLPGPNWKVVAIPGVVVLLGMAGATGQWAPYLWLPVAGWVLELVYGRVRMWHGRAAVRHVALGVLGSGDVIRDWTAGSAGGTVAEEWLPARRPLRREELQRIREAIRAGELDGIQTVQVEEALPAAPFIVAGTVATALLGGSLAAGAVRTARWLAG